MAWSLENMLHKSLLHRSQLLNVDIKHCCCLTYPTRLESTSVGIITVGWLYISRFSHSSAFFSNVARVLSRLLLCSQLIYADRNYDGSKRRENLERSASQNHNIENLVDVSMPQLPNSVSPISFLSFIIQHRCEKKGRNFPLFPVLLVLKYIMMLLS